MAVYVTGLVALCQICAAAVLLVGVLGWTAAGLSRRRELRRTIERGRGPASQKWSPPPVTVVLPVRGCRPASRANWASQLNSSYDGPLRFVFVVDSESDPAVPVLRELLQHRRAEQAGAGRLEAHPPEACADSDPGDSTPRGARYALRPRRAPAETASASPLNRCGLQHQPGVAGGGDALVVSGPATHCSQKIHNLLAGIAAAAQGGPPGQSGYVLALDDDVALHAGTITRLVEELEGDESAFMATGAAHQGAGQLLGVRLWSYPFDLVPRGASLSAYAALCYHLPLSIAFTVSRRAPFVWGGCMMLRLRDVQQDDRRGVIKLWREGGYSDDLLLAALAARDGLPVATHRAALLPQLLPAAPGWGAYWNYLRRQIWVLDTYGDDHCRRLHHAALAVHTAASAVLAVSLVAASWQLACAMAPALGAAAAAALAAAQAHGGANGELRTLLAPLASLLAPAAPAAAVPLPWAWARCRTGAAAAVLCAAAQGVWWQRTALVLFAVSAAAAQCALLFWARQSMLLLHALAAEGADKGGGKGGSSAAVLAQAGPLSWPRVWVGLAAESITLPLCAAMTLLSHEIEWAGIRYRKRRGRVEVVSRP
ncbi:hypothetical protein Rsub_12822 [Raphidocelis subcapitata]|uniref:ceramide glucosyltransferase n=1 Tax=Raphidocelis subcapitata TaxID=307507 RepID=A0A2V0PJD8_9CHLO|nr:hypothetical protein Rsub_12822 [Raphidocelis subcapitata]|eukprot:GBF99914.1 hypothetical protein Rsub_12822 [Raphidocelis subcapitata]